MLGSKNGSSVSRLKVDPRCAVEIVHFDNEAGILLHVGLRGRASVERMNALRSILGRTRGTGTLGSFRTWQQLTTKMG